MRFAFSFVDHRGRELFAAEADLTVAIEALREAQRVAEHVVTEQAYLCDFGNAFVHVQSEDLSLQMRLSVKYLLDSAAAGDGSGSKRMALPLERVAAAWFSEETQSWRVSH